MSLDPEWWFPSWVDFSLGATLVRRLTDALMRGSQGGGKGIVWCERGSFAPTTGSRVFFARPCPGARSMVCCPLAGDWTARSLHRLVLIINCCLLHAAGLYSIQLALLRVHQVSILLAPLVHSHFPLSPFLVPLLSMARKRHGWGREGGSAGGLWA